MTMAVIAVMKLLVGVVAVVDRVGPAVDIRAALGNGFVDADDVGHRAHHKQAQHQREERRKHRGVAGIAGHDRRISHQIALAYPAGPSASWRRLVQNRRWGLCFPCVTLLIVRQLRSVT